ncbi:NnrU family protein [Pacificimonas flava]|uniref:NnrU domain-containing protein n=1 Tax=Pacificimonas flava TaxID=1234595 RepID=M2SCP3_9SPHN|nr:NnrU family protein [Pacificimonas flava]EMD83145.1 hypothetical protein C725_1046 [Pacificimonas flava]MBB5279290.1 putative membrane protein [Pacificimonas flava]
MVSLTAAMALFVGTHFLMSHPLRGPMVGALGEKGFLGVYSLISLALIAWAGFAYWAADGVQFWYASTWAVAAGHVLMILASILFVGSVIAPNPALVGAGGLLAGMDEPRGVMRITRHPMMWSFALWALVHIALAGRADTLVFAGGIAFLALAGSAGQDARKRRQLGEAWAAYAGKTSYWPRPAWPGILPVVLGAAFYAALVWLHPLLIGRTTRLWEVF